MKATMALAAVCAFVGGMASAATITGKVNFKGSAPKPQPIRMSSDPYCAKANATPKMQEKLIVNNGGVQNAFVYIKSGVKPGTGKALTTPVKFDQNGCIYVPRVFGVMVNQPIEILNSDATLHNVHSMAKKNANFNMGMATKGQKITKSFAKPETMVKVKCDVHGWMTAYVGVLDHPFFAVSDSNGSFTIKDLPPGEYTVEAWHENWPQPKTETVKVAADGETKNVDFTFQAGGTL